MRLPDVKVETEYVAFAGGIDRITPAISIKPGFAIDAMNYEHGLNGGYQRIDGFERFDGRASPSAAVYYYATVNVGAGGSKILQVGEGVVGSTSGATATVAYCDPLVVPLLPSGNAQTVALTNVVGIFVADESLKIGGGGLPLLLTMTYTRPSGPHFIGAPVLGGAPASDLDAILSNLAADVYRALVNPAPGNGPVRGVNLLKGVLYAFRDNEFGTACQMWKATASGWAFVPLGFELAFSVGVLSIAEGDTVVGSISGASAVVKRVAVQSGTFEGHTAQGRLVFAAVSGVFLAETLKVGSNVVATIGGPASAINLLPGGAFEFDNFNFSGSTDTLRMYGADGVNRAFESDGTVFVPIVTGMAVDTPTHPHAHKNQLFLSFHGSSQNSGIGKPYAWTAVTGADEIGVGADVSAYSSQTGDVLAIFSRNKSDQLQGSTVDDFVLKPLSTKYGAIPGTVQTIGGTYYFDDSGIRQLTRTQDYGSFNDEPQSELLQPIIDLIRDKVVASSVYRARGQYRVYASDGSGIIVTLKSQITQYGNTIQNVIGMTQLQYPVSVTCACSGEDATGKDVVFFGASNGYVYQGDKGSSFDGEEIEAYLRTPFNHSKSPRQRKRYRKAVMELTTVRYSSIRFSPEFTYGDSDVSAPRIQSASVIGAGGYWNSANWGQFVWSGRLVNAPEFSIEGTGTNMSLLFYSKSDIDLGHALQGVLLHYTPRRQAR